MGLLRALGNRIAGALGRDMRPGASLHRAYGGLSNAETKAMGPAQLLSRLPMGSNGMRMDPNARRQLEQIASDLGGLGPEDLAALDDASLVQIVQRFGASSSGAR